jgi:predicted RNA-binding protein with PIN domain
MKIKIVIVFDAQLVHTYSEMHVNHADNDHRCISTMSSLQLYTKP